MCQGALRWPSGASVVNCMIWAIFVEIPSNLGWLCRKWHEKSMENDRKMMKVGEKVFFYIQNSQQQYKVIGTLGRSLARSKGSPTPHFFAVSSDSRFLHPWGSGWPAEPAILWPNICMFGPRRGMNSGPMKLISGAWDGAGWSTKPLEMSFIGPLFILHRGPNMPIWGNMLMDTLLRRSTPLWALVPQMVLDVNLHYEVNYNVNHDKVKNILNFVVNS